MATEDSSSNQRYQGYTNLQNVSDRVSRTIEDGVAAISRLDSAHNENAQVRPDSAAQNRAAIVEAMVTLTHELEKDRDTVHQYDDILTRWWDGDGDEPSYMQRLQQTQLTETRPGFLIQLGLDLRTAGWELGYLRAGQQSLAEADMSDKERIKEKLA